MFRPLMAMALLALGVGFTQPPRQPTTQPATQPAAERSRFFSPAQWESQRDFEQRLNALPDHARLRQWHDALAGEPHVAGTPGDQRMIDFIARSFADMGLQVQVHEFWALLCEPVDAALEIVSSPIETVATQPHAAEGDASPPALPTRSRRGVISLPITEDNLLNDSFVAHPGLSFGWNAYSGSGDVTAGVVYANYGTKEDFETLKARGIDCTGRIVLARYGGNFRGYKVKYAEQAGAAGVIIFTDPDDAGYRKGITYPEGGWANDTCIQRGSIITNDSPGDPLTPGRPATKDAVRLDVDKVGLPRIPVQPIGYRAAQAIMQRMRGTPLPPDLIKTWQGGLACAYRLDGGDELRVRLMVEQKREVRRSANIIATLEGEIEPDQVVYVGSHHDAWGFGAGDPASGTMLVMEAARTFAEMARQGMRPRRSIAFCCWGAEEFGIIGSTEFCEQYADDLRRHAVAYINLDGATMGSAFGASSDPLLKTLIEEAARAVPQARDSANRSVYDAWKGDKHEPSFGNLGGGSDHIGFYGHLGVPSCFLSASGAPGTAYHSNYDNLAWYRQTVGDDYQPALMLTRMVNIMLARLASAEIAPLDAARYVTDLRQHVKGIAERVQTLSLDVPLEALTQAIDELDVALGQANAAIDAAHARDDAAALTARLNLQATLSMQPWPDLWMPRWPGGIDGRPWFRNYYASSDPNSGYAAWMLPALRGPIEASDTAGARAAVGVYREIIQSLTVQARALGDAANLGNEPTVQGGESSRSEGSTSP